MKKQAKIIAGSSLGALVAIAVAASLLSPLRLELTEMVPQTAAVTFTEQGAYDYDRSLQVYPLVSGELLEVLVEEGDLVQKGDSLAVVSARDYAYEIEQLESSIQGYHAQIVGLREQEQQQRDTLLGNRNNLLGQLEALGAQVDTAQMTDTSRQRQITLQEDVVHENVRMVRYYWEQLRDARSFGDWETEAAMEQYLNQARQAEANSRVVLEQLRAGDNAEGYYEGQIQGIQAQIDSIDQQLSKSYTAGMTGYYNSLIASAQTGMEQLEEKQGQATITAPVSGVVRHLYADRANVVSQQGELAIIAWDPCVEVFVSTRELDHVQLGDVVELTLDKRAGDRTLTGRVVRIGETAQIRYSALGVEERKVRVLIRPEEELTIGGALDVTFTVYRAEESLVAPKTAVFVQDGQDMVWVVRDGKAQKAAIEKGMETRDGYVVLSGLDRGELVVRDANEQSLSQGKRVRDTPG